MTQTNGYSSHKIPLRETFGSQASQADDRLRREARIQALMPDQQDDDMLGKIYDSRLIMATATPTSSALPVL